MWIARAGVALAFVLASAACGDGGDAPPAGSDTAICRELSKSWESLLADESSATARRIGEALAGSANGKLREASALYLAAAHYPRNPDGTVTLDAAREHVVDRLVMIKNVVAGCSAIGVEPAAQMREAGEAAEAADGIPTEEELAANDPVVVKVGETALMEGKDGTGAVRVTLANPVRATTAPDGEKPENATFLVLDVTMVGVKGTYVLSSGSFSFKASDATVSYPAYVPSFTPELKSGSVGPGKQFTGKLVFDLPAGAIAGGQILLEDFGFDMTALPGAIWTMP